MSAIDTIRAGSGRSSPGFSPSFPAPLSVFAALVDMLEKMAQKRRGRRMLLEMSDEQLKDIGISRADAHREANRIF